MIETLRFPIGLPGFPGERSFSVEMLDGAPLVRLWGEGPADPCFLVLTEPVSYFPDLAPLTVEDDEAVLLGAPDAADVTAWLILTVREDSVTANLLGPLVVNLRDGLAIQLVGSDPAVPVAAPLGQGAEACSC